jgi:hypothetical protein
MVMKTIDHNASLMKKVKSTNRNNAVIEINKMIMTELLRMEVTGCVKEI